MEKSMRRLIVILIGWLAFSPLSGAAPKEATYDVEILVFETQMPDFDGAELWTYATRSPHPTAMVIEGLSPSNDFSNAMASLRNDGRYRVLLHKRWSQVAESKSSKPPVLLSTENELNGTFKFYLSRFLHVELNVAYQPASGSPEAASINGLPTFVINEQRRIKSNEMNYFDHPKFGVLVRVTPIPG